MMNRFVWTSVVTASVVSIACGGQKKSAALPAADSTSGPSTSTMASHGKRQIVFMGTSLTAGLGLEPDQAFTALIVRRIDSLGLNYAVRNAGVSGETSAGALRRIPWVLRDTVDVFVLETGANDGLRGLGVDSMRANIAAILDSVKHAWPRATLFLAEMNAPPNLGSRYTSAFHDAFVDLSRKNGATLIPFLLGGVAGNTSLNQNDGIHPNVEGERIVADNVWRALAPALREGSR